MTVYQIRYQDYLEGLDVRAFTDQPAARRAAERLPTAMTAFTFETSEDLGAEVPRGPLLLGLYNAMTGEGVKRFSDREAGLRRVFEVIEKKAEPGEVVPQARKEVSKMEAQTAEVQEQTQGQANGEAKPKRAGRSATYQPHQVISVKTDKNSKRGASRDRFALYQTGMTVKDYLNAGGRSSDLKWDVDHEFISIA